MLLALLGSWRVPELRKRLLFTAGIIALYRAGSYLPVPGVQTDALKNFFGGSNNTILSVLNLFSGGALANLSLFALGIMPYITASIILQLHDRRRPGPGAAPEGGRGRATRRSRSTRATSPSGLPRSRPRATSSCSTTARRSVRATCCRT